uniref:Secreted protein n=1 Tax=Oryctolagus cuniculus TaxID=9986 RepID=A0A5F9CBV9_RABIT
MPTPSLFFHHLLACLSLHLFAEIVVYGKDTHSSYRSRNHTEMLDGLQGQKDGLKGSLVICRSFLLCHLLFWLRNNLFLLSEDHLDVARGAHVRVDPAVGSVGPAAHLGGLVHLDVLNDHRIYIQTLQLSITLCIFKHVQQKLGTFFGPTTLGPTPLLGLGTSTNSTIVPTEWHTLLL